MAKIGTQFAQVFIHYYSNKSTSTSKLFISEPNKAQEEKMGRLFGIIEINTPSKENSAIINQLINSIEDNYYSQAEEKRLNMEKCFEQALDHANLEFNRILQEKKFYLVGNLNEYTIKEKINLAVGVIKDNQIFLTYLNKSGIFLIHKTKQDYKIIDIKKISGEEEAKDSQQDQEGQMNKLFSNLIKGEILPDDYLFIANASFLDYVSLERIKKTVTSLPINKAAEYFKNSLLQFEGQNFAAILFKNFINEPNKSSPSAPLTSITELNYTETSTEKLLAPSLFANIKSISYLAIDAARKVLFTNKNQDDKANEDQESNKTKLTEENKSPIKNQTKAENKKILTPFKDFIEGISIKIKKIFRNISAQTPKFNEKLYNLKKFTRLKLAYFGNYLRKIPNLSKILLVIAALMIILFVYSTSYLKHQQEKEDFSQEFQANVVQIEEKINLAESNLIFGDESAAREEIQNAQNLISNLITDSNKQKQNQEELNNRIEQIIAKLRKITIISEPLLIADLAEQQENNIDIKNIVYQNNTVIAFDSINNNSYKINIESDEVEKNYSNLNDIGKIKKARKIGDKILIYHDKHGFLEFIDNKLQPINADLAPGGQLADFAMYSDRLYTIDSKLNQIYRHSQSASGYGSGLVWLKENAQLNNVNSIGIDVNIWLLTNDGQIWKYNKGFKQSFQPKNLEPKLESASQIFTNEQINNLYILDPTSKRIIVFNKNGELITQYYSEIFDNLKAFEVIENEKKIFLINDNKIYSFLMTHL